MVQTQTTRNKSDLTFKAYMAIRQMLFYNEIQPGQKIKYKDLATRIGVSMTPVIQALKWLEFLNIVRHESNKGYYINEVSVKEITEVYDTRLLLEVSLVPGIIGHLNDQGIRQLAATLDDYKAAVAEDNYHKRIMTDMTFHMTLAALSKCHIQVKMLQELFDILLLRYNQNLFYLSMTGTSLAEHEDIFNCIKKRDQVRLEASLKFHVDTVRNHITQGMRRLIPDKKESF
ncbi:MAG: GntR family transcriptional regulator [Desulfotignum sp.]|nr:GntR family transcriptional regulator [Desulfotignum sp.]